MSFSTRIVSLVSLANIVIVLLAAQSVYAGVPHTGEQPPTDQPFTVRQDTSGLHIVPAGDQTLCEGESVVLQGAAGFTDYLWSTGDPGRSITVDAAGQYWLQAKNATGETVYSDTISVAVFAVPEPVATALTDTVVCPGTAVTISTNAGYAAYEWSNGQTAQSIEVYDAGVYYVRAMNTGGCWGKSNEITVTHKVAPKPNIEGDKQLCSNEEVQKYFSQSAPWYLNQWSVTGGTIVGRADRDTVYIQWEQDVFGTLTLQQTETRTGCIVAVTDTVAVRAIDPALNVPGDIMACGTPSIALSALAGYEGYLWSNGSTTPQIDVTESGDYYVTITQANCQATSDTINVRLLESIPTVIDGPAIGCRGDDVVYSATHYIGASYTWSIDNGEIIAGQGSSSVTVNWINLSPAKIRVDVSLDACTAGDSVDITVHQVQKPLLSLDGGPDLCEGDTLTITATEGYDAYLWTNGATTNTIRVTEPGVYAVSGISATGCSVMSDTITVSVYPYPAKPDILYEGDTLACTVEGASYTWYLNDIVLPDDTTQRIAISKSGVYRVVVSNPAGCGTSSDDLTFTGIGRYAPSLARRFDVSPNPNNGTFSVALEFQSPAICTVRLVNVAGQTVYEEHSHHAEVSFYRTVRIERPVPGMYFLIVESAGAWDFRKVVIHEGR